MSQYKKSVYVMFNYLLFDFENYSTNKEQQKRFHYICYLIYHFFGLNIDRYTLRINGICNEGVFDVGYELANEPDYYEEITKDVKLTTDAKNFLELVNKHVFNNVDLLDVYCNYLYLIKEDYSKKKIWERLIELKGYIIKDNLNYYKNEINKIHLDFCRWVTI